MKPPRIIYLLFLLSWGALLVMCFSATTNFRTGEAKPVVFVVIAGLAVYFSYYMVKRARFDLKVTESAKTLDDVTMLNAGAVKQLCQIEAGRGIKLRIRLSCKDYSPEDSFPLRS